MKYSEALKELEGIVSDLEKGDTDIDVLAEKLQRAIELNKFCKDRLKATEGKITGIIARMEDPVNGG